MRNVLRLSRWGRGHVAAAAASWTVLSAAALSLWIVAEARGFARAFTAAASSLGATSVEMEVDLLGGWAQLLPLYLGVAVFPSAVLVLLWRRARRRASGDASAAAPAG